MEAVKEYKVVSAGHVDILSQIVNKMIAEGWQPVGHAQITHNNYHINAQYNVGIIVIQTMVR